MSTVSQQRRRQERQTAGLSALDPRWFLRMIASMGWPHFGQARATLFPKASQGISCAFWSTQRKFVTVATGLSSSILDEIYNRALVVRFAQNGVEVMRLSVRTTRSAGPHLD